VTRALDLARHRFPGFDHAIRAYQRYKGEDGDALAASVTYFGFLSFFPLVALGFSVLGFVVANDASLRNSVEDALSQALPGIIGTGSNQINVDQIADAKAGAGIIGILGLLYAGLGWVDALRQVLRKLWHQHASDGNIIVKKLKDVVILVGLGLALLASVVVSSGATTATNSVLDWLGLSGSLAAKAVLKALGPLLGIAADIVVFGWLYTRLANSGRGREAVLRGTLLMALLFEVLKQIGAFYLQATTSNPLYGTFAALIGLLIWINVVSRLFLICGAWIVTEPAGDTGFGAGTSIRAAAG
jgi:membrane protein